MKNKGRRFKFLLFLFSSSNWNTSFMFSRRHQRFLCQSWFYWDWISMECFNTLMLSLSDRDTVTTLH